jgi:inhibitor of KinA sporulation pathway (predicted exonuclease)
MNYLIFDLEFNQDFNIIKEDKSRIKSNCPFEIIQIGAVKLNENLKTISNFDRLIKPVIYTELHPYVKEITGITIQQLNIAKPFIDIYKELIDFMGKDKIVLGVWGMADIKELFRNIQYQKLDTSIVPKEYINIQTYASSYLNCPKGTHIGLRNAVELLDISLKSRFHDAFHDACYTAEVFKKIYNKNIETKIYNLDKNNRLNRPNNGKQKVDFYKLIKQFEKMFNREMTEEEKSIIKLAYMMGKTNQFQIS